LVEYIVVVLMAEILSGGDQHGHYGSQRETGDCCQST